MKTKVLVYKTKQTIEEEQYYEVDEETYNDLKKATPEERMKFWNTFNVWENKLVGDHSDSWTKEEINYGTHHD